MAHGYHQSDPPSGRFVLRLKPEHHAALRSEAREQGLSLNEYCSRRLALPPGTATSHDGPTSAVGRAAMLFGRQLVGAVAFGSWARGEEASGSDIDVLVIVESSVAIDRAIYRRWDEKPIRWSDRNVDPHFVHLPPTCESVTGLWAEIARDGIVLHDREFRVSRFLAKVRERLLEGSVIRHTVFGQPYWMEASIDAKP
jgi:predicted nucleotidyltransferase